jgi:hypothetical protein
MPKPGAASAFNASAFRSVLQAEGRLHALQYNITGTPETFVIDSEGNVAKYYIGQQRWTSPRMLAMLDEMIPN